MTCKIIGQQFLPSEDDEEGQRTYQLMSLVESDTGLDGPANVRNTPGLSTPGTTWNVTVDPTAGPTDSDPWAWCKANLKIEPLEVKDEKVKHWQVIQTFSTKPQSPNHQRCMDNPITDPLLEPPKISGSFVKEKEPATFDRFGWSIVNSAHELVKGPQVEFDKNRPTIIIEMNVATALQAYQLPGMMADCVNMFPIWGFPVRTVKLSQPKWTREYYGTCLVYYKRTLEFEVEKKTWDRWLLDEGTKVLNGHWDQATGNWVLDDIDGSPPNSWDPNHFIAFTDRNGQAARVILDGNGRPSGVRIQGRRPRTVNNNPYTPAAPNAGQWFSAAAFGITNIYTQPGDNVLSVLSAGHGLSTGQQVFITGVVGVQQANGQWTVTVLNVNVFTLNGSVPQNPLDPLPGLIGGQWSTMGQVLLLINATPNVCTTQLPHGLVTGAQVEFSGTQFCDDVVWTITKLSNTTFSLNGSTGVNVADTWDAAAEYSIGDQVEVAGVVYVCIATNLNEMPPNPTFWEIATTPTVDEAAGPGQVFVTKYDEADFLLLGIPTSF